MQDVRNLADLVRRSAASRGDQPALRWHDRMITWAQLDAQVDAVAADLRSAVEADGGVDAGNGGHAPGPAEAGRVAIAMHNVPEFAAVYFGVLRAGLVAVPINTAYTGRELRNILDDSAASVLVAADSVLDALGKAPAGGGGQPRQLRTYSMGDLASMVNLAELTGGAGGAGHGPVEAVTGDGDLAVLLYTSGTAGAPKGAMLSHRALLTNHAQLAALDPAPVGTDDVLLLAVPLFHAYGLNSGLGAIAYHGACGVLVERFDPADTLDLIERHGVTAVLGVPPMFIAWSLMGDRLARAFRNVRIAVSGAAPLDPAAAGRFRAATGAPLQEGYGLTETAPVLTSTLASPQPKAGSIGRPIPQVQVRLVDSAGEDVDLDDVDDDDEGPEGTPGTDPGELVVRGPNLFDGYWPDGHGGPDADGWWATGDVAYADADGDLFLVDRLGELILVSGFNVYPREVELVIDGHPEVTESAAVAVPHPYTGQTVKAYVALAPGARLTAEELITYCERQLARFKCPTAVEFVAELPRSATGKVRKSALAPQ